MFMQSKKERNMKVYDICNAKDADLCTEYWRALGYPVGLTRKYESRHNKVRRM